MGFVRKAMMILIELPMGSCRNCQMSCNIHP
ncbi:Uncharacterised protein [Mycobacterium tuberculosis]|uniref:Uncharacterized protein n=1 Tax=Mycobacterium tuberculosis TaxID=1773 RepID=A0A916LF34_MYCTX|nr:Uncharacterised protein [Mycobacterium tuberculosis]COZ89018.1 Uncharacterised protein [Mycobacterium tuberculosis]CPA45889.1 Uncharacterised protein [Mycobacterium tuberculosis]CPA90932.1 Uncharacterised protein [Mycobacterium tuberculosis]